uniref:NADH-ubiquinone oxidoreductase chain 3 n=1 Tax=Protohermes concolorus TaxID=508445 RepID=B6RZW1_9NEOP|nr:NADH dehydrogenase subunit 3 [Protohermes concolorus]ACA51950.1 NADH dehydrogenase subunit 3 [Protohermes concolorus]UFZ12949.1 NADH dehydrogenase subunit 3 [Protohermes concolorus]
MISLLIMSILILMISFIIMMLATILSKKSFIDREKASPFECGFDPISSSRLPFSLRFFLIAVIFLIFDVEIALLFPLILIMNFSSIMMWFIVSSIFILILLIGLYHEWNQGALNWAN